MTEGFVLFLYDTFVWTAGLIALVLLLRRPVSRYFGPQAAYALWLLPFLRLVLPPVILPASWQPDMMAPVVQAVPTSVPEADAAGMGVMSSPVADAGFAQPFDLTTVTLIVWLTGAVLFLASRYRGYFTMRRALLVDARCVGRAGKVRLLETPQTRAPLAFGVIDKIVMLPEGFMAQHDLASRDLALEHELAHHKGRDLLANFVAQPLFALHWFNPLAHLAWRAMRRDQEAACDARVMDNRAAEDRSAYANVIASFAAGANLSLAAPMACPVLGEKSIIHRLRSLNMNQLSNRRRNAGRGLIALAAITLPLTATISYAEAVAPTPPAPPAAPHAPVAPEAPLAPIAPNAPLPPVAPLAPPVPDASASGRDMVWVEENVDASDDGRKEIRKEYRVIRNGKDMTPEERAEFEKDMAEMRRDLADAHRDVADAMREVKEVHRIALKDVDGPMTVVETNCKGDGEMVREESASGKKIIRICQARIMAHALKGLKQARKEIASSKDMPEEARTEALRSIDSEIANWGNDKS